VVGNGNTLECTSDTDRITVYRQRYEDVCNVKSPVFRFIRDQSILSKINQVVKLWDLKCAHRSTIRLQLDKRNNFVYVFENNIPRCAPFYICMFYYN
jgi:hypothetical protein